LFDTIQTVTPQERIQVLCQVIAVETSPEELRALSRQLEFAITEYTLDMQNRAVRFSHPPKTSAA